MGLAEQKPFEELSDLQDDTLHCSKTQHQSWDVRLKKHFPSGFYFVRSDGARQTLHRLAIKTERPPRGALESPGERSWSYSPETCLHPMLQDGVGGGHSFWGCKAALQSISPSHSQKNQLVEALRNLSCESGWSGHLYRIAGLGSSARTWEGSSLG